MIFPSAETRSLVGGAFLLRARSAASPPPSAVNAWTSSLPSGVRKRRSFPPTVWRMGQIDPGQALLASEPAVVSRALLSAAVSAVSGIAIANTVTAARATAPRVRDAALYPR